jgi:polysaccharide chain length determinant protein (PEP-CTERM system associated)
VIPQRVPETYVRSTVTSRIEDRLRTISQQILSRTRLERIINDFKLYPVESKTKLMEEIVEQMRLQVGIELVKGDSFKLTFVYDDPEVAAKVTERLASLFIDENLRDRETQADSTSQFLEAQLTDARRRLVEQEKRLEQYRKQHSGTLPSQMPSNLQAIQTTQQQIQSLNEATNRYRDRRNVVQRLIAENEGVVNAAALAPPLPEPAGQATVQTGTTAQQLEAARRSLQALQLRLRSEHPDVQRQLRQIKELEDKAAAEAAANPPTEPAPRPVPANPALLAAQNRIAEFQAELKNIDQQVAKNEAEEVRLRDVVSAYQARLESLPTRESELTELTRDYATLQESYRTLLAKREDSTIAANLERRQIGEQFRIIDPARTPERPYSPNRLLIDLIGLVLGLAIGLGGAVALEVFDSTIRSEEEVGGEFNLATLAVVPLVLTAGQARARRRRAAAAAAMGCVVMAVSLGFVVWKLGLLGR